jgi:hypothetical protein
VPVPGRDPVLTTRCKQQGCVTDDQTRVVRFAIELVEVRELGVSGDELWSDAPDVLEEQLE